MTAELKQRLVFSAIGIPLLLAVFWLGGWFLWAFLLVMAILGNHEFNMMMPLGKEYQNVAVSIVITAFIYLFMTLVPNMALFPLCVLAGTLIGYFVYRLTGMMTQQRYVMNLTYNLGIVYTVFFPGLIYMLDKHYHSQNILLLLVVLIWITDSAAYFIGMSFGRHRGIFPMSPNKSLEGFVAGLAAPFIFMLAVYQINPYWTIKQIILVCLCAGLVGQLGDLLESKLKRIAGVKDSSHLIPGHGGVLDRFDSLLLAAPVLYVLLRLIP